MLTSWCDWSIPLHWGGMSDPFQPIERHTGVSKACLELLADREYPFVVSTKGRLVGEPVYLELLAKCNAAVQVSMVAPAYDRLEPGAPDFAERLRLVREVTPAVRRLIIRIQPYAPGLLAEVLKWLPAYAEFGVHGVTIEGMKRQAKVPGMVRVAGDLCYPLELLRRDFKAIRTVCRENGLAFYCAENRLRSMGDDSCCCGVADMSGFRVNVCNMNHLGPEPLPYTERMRDIGTARPFKALRQCTVHTQRLKVMSYMEAMDVACRSRRHRQAMGLPV
ncbi:MAG: hypothetical protein JSU86_01805 [Phycisphaerales bacterium]|nr:MAG: hypothetical protein JSU86_01805 [Phycisphaerales bacterium]